MNAKYNDYYYVKESTQACRTLYNVNMNSPGSLNKYEGNLSPAHALSSDCYGVHSECATSAVYMSLPQGHQSWRMRTLTSALDSKIP
jgi:hypothetical protein